MAAVWEGKDRRVIKPVLSHKNSCFRDSFFGYSLLLYFIPKKFVFTKISHCISGRKFKSRAYQLLVYYLPVCIFQKQNKNSLLKW